MPSITITVTGEEAIQRQFNRRQGLALLKTLQKATRAAATAVKPAIVAEAPVRTGNLRRSIRVAATRRDRPGAYVGPSSKRAFYRHFVIRGTVRGVRANPFVSRGASHAEGAAKVAFDLVVKDDLK